jgi:ribonuclease D
LQEAKLAKHQKAELFEHDLPLERLEHYSKKQALAIDTETRGLVIARDRLCIVQICDDEGLVTFVRYHGEPAPNLKKLLENKNVLKVFHFARFDVAVLKHYLQAVVEPVFCTKIGSKLVRTYTEYHSLKDLVREFLGIELDKTNQSSDWASENLSESQIEYAANDVRVLLPIYDIMVDRLKRERLLDLAQRLGQTVPLIAELDLKGYQNMFEHR